MAEHTTGALARVFARARKIALAKTRWRTWRRTATPSTAHSTESAEWRPSKEAGEDNDLIPPNNRTHKNKERVPDDNTAVHVHRLSGGS